MRAQEKTLQGWRRLLGGLIRDPRERLLGVKALALRLAEEGRE